MATIRSALQLYDGMTPALRSVTKSLNIVISSFESLQSVGSKAVDTASLTAAREELAKSAVLLDNAENSIKQAGEAQRGFNSNLRGGRSEAVLLLSAMKAAGAYIGAQRMIGLSDDLTQTTARLNLMNDGQQTTAELQEKIRASAQRSRGEYLATAEAVSKIGLMAKDAFNNNDELIRFTELINKQFAVAGTSAEGVSAAMLQLTQALSSGVLRGEELNSVFEQAPVIIENIADYLGVGIGEIRNLASEGEITADIVKRSVLSATDEINARFESMPATWSQVWTMAQNRLLQTFQPLFDIISEGARLTAENWEVIEPVMWGLSAAVTVLTLSLIAQSDAFLAASVKAQMFFVKLTANPMFWAAAAIGVATAALIKWTEAAGGAEIAWLICVHYMRTAADSLCIGFIAAGVGIMNAFDDMAASGEVLKLSVLSSLSTLKAQGLLYLQDFVNKGADILNSFISFANTIPGVSIAAIPKASFGTSAAADIMSQNRQRSAQISTLRNASDARQTARTAWVDSMKNSAVERAAARLGEIRAVKLEAERNAQHLSTAEITVAPTVLDEISGNTRDTADFAASMADKMDMSEEDLKYLRDIAEREAVNRFTTAELKLEFYSENHINSDMDIDGVVEAITERTAEALAVAAEGVYS